MIISKNHIFVFKKYDIKNQFLYKKVLFVNSYSAH